MDQQITRYEIFGLIAGIILGAVPVLGVLAGNATRHFRVK